MFPRSDVRSITVNVTRLRGYVMRTCYRLYRSCGFGRVYSFMRCIGCAVRVARRFDTRMHRVWFGVLVLVLVSGCNASPITASRLECERDDMPSRCERIARVVPTVDPSIGERLAITIGHGHPVSMPDGSIGYACMTQPRGYTNADGTAAWAERDWYVSGVACPAIPID
jgi:hypothetical protein